jgi:hypothetical protein
MLNAQEVDFVNSMAFQVGGALVMTSLPTTYDSSLIPINSQTADFILTRVHSCLSHEFSGGFHFYKIFTVQMLSSYFYDNKARHSGGCLHLVNTKKRKEIINYERRRRNHGLLSI